MCSESSLQNYDRSLFGSESLSQMYIYTFGQNGGNISDFLQILVITVISWFCDIQRNMFSFKIL